MAAYHLTWASVSLRVANLSQHAVRYITNERICKHDGLLQSEWALFCFLFFPLVNILELKKHHRQWRRKNGHSFVTAGNNNEEVGTKWIAVKALSKRTYHGEAHVDKGKNRWENSNGKGARKGGWRTTFPANIFVVRRCYNIALEYVIVRILFGWLPMQPIGLKSIQ